MINLFFSGTAAGKANLYRKEIGIRDDPVLWVDLMLHAGDISLPFSVERRKNVYNAYFDLDLTVSENIRKLKKALKNDDRLCLWYTKTDADEYLGMLAATAQFHGQGIVLYCCDCSHLCTCISHLDLDADLASIEPVCLSESMIAERLSEWKDITALNTPLRIMQNGKILSLPEDYIDDRICSFIGDKEVGIGEICSHILKQEDMDRKLGFVLLRIRQLIAEGKLVVIRTGYTPVGSHYGMPMKDIMKYAVKLKK